jgi:hypothetical protein
VTKKDVARKLADYIRVRRILDRLSEDFRRVKRLSRSANLVSAGEKCPADFYIRTIQTIFTRIYILT